MSPRMRVGSWVRLKIRRRDGAQKARIERRFDDFARGAVRLDRPLGDFRWWNVDDLVACEPPKKGWD